MPRHVTVTRSGHPGGRSISSGSGGSTSISSTSTLRFGARARSSASDGSGLGGGWSCSGIQNPFTLPMPRPEPFESRIHPLRSGSHRAAPPMHDGLKYGSWMFDTYSDGSASARPAAELEGAESPVFSGWGLWCREQ